MGQANNNKKTGQQKIDILIARGEMKPGTKWEDLSAAEQYAADRLADEYYYRETRVNPVKVQDEKDGQGSTNPADLGREPASESGGTGLQDNGGTQEVPAGESEKTDSAVEKTQENSAPSEQQDSAGNSADGSGETGAEAPAAAGEPTEASNSSEAQSGADEGDSSDRQDEPPAGGN